MIDIENAKNEFLEHVKKLELDNPRAQTKITHTFRVAKICKNISNNLNLTQEQIQLAELIGILHDIGRFEQYKTCNQNKKINHGVAGVEVLKNNQYIRKYIDNNKYDNIILTAIYEHNRYELNTELSEEEKLFSKIVRDADKLDIIYEAIYIFWQQKEEMEKIEKEQLSSEMLKDFYLGKLSNINNRKSQIDQILRFSSFIYDINYKCSFEMLKQSDNISKMIDRFNYKILDTKMQMMKVKEIANTYIENQTKI